MHEQGDDHKSICAGDPCEQIARAQKSISPELPSLAFAPVRKLQRAVGAKLFTSRVVVLPPKKLAIDLERARVGPKSTVFA